MNRPASIHMERVAQLPCCVCGAHGVHVHHILQGRTPGRKAPDWLVLPLCPSCHTGTHGIHGNQAMLKAQKLTEFQLLNDTLEKLYGGRLQ